MVPREREARGRLQEGGGRRGGARAGAGQRAEHLGALDVHPLAVQVRPVPRRGQSVRSQRRIDSWESVGALERPLLTAAGLTGVRVRKGQCSPSCCFPIRHAPHMVTAEQAVSVTMLGTHILAVLPASQSSMAVFVGLRQATETPLPVGAHGARQCWECVYWSAGSDKDGELVRRPARGGPARDIRRP